MRSFNEYQLTLLEKAIEEEATKDIRVHSVMERETAELYAWYNKYPEDDLTYQALLLLLEWWGVYFACGYETAQQIKEEIYRKAIKKL